MKTTEIYNKVRKSIFEIIDEASETSFPSTVELSDKHEIILESLIESVTELIEDISDEDVKVICESPEQYEFVENAFAEELLKESSYDLFERLMKEISPDRKHELMEEILGVTIENSF